MKKFGFVTVAGLIFLGGFIWWGVFDGKQEPNDLGSETGSSNSFPDKKEIVTGERTFYLTRYNYELNLPEGVKLRPIYNAFGGRESLLAVAIEELPGMFATVDKSVFKNPERLNLTEWMNNLPAIEEGVYEPISETEKQLINDGEVLRVSFFERGIAERYLVDWDEYVLVFYYRLEPPEGMEEVKKYRKVVKKMIASLRPIE